MDDLPLLTLSIKLFNIHYTSFVLIHQLLWLPCYNARMLRVYPSRFARLQGRTYVGVKRHAMQEYHLIQKQNPKRHTYILSSYFRRGKKKQKIFLDQFWEHLDQKNRVDGLRRVKLFMAALDVLQNTRFDPEVRPDPERRHQILYRFAGKTSDGTVFYVQVKANMKTGRKYFMSVFPILDK